MECGRAYRARPALEQAFELEAQQRHRHREKAHSELGGQLSPGNDLAQTNRPAHDPTPDDAVGFLSEARRFRGRFHGGMSITRHLQGTRVHRVHKGHLEDGCQGGSRTY